MESYLMSNVTVCSAAVISDANVLIDYISVERTKVLRLVTEYLFPIKFPHSILNEVKQLTEDKAEVLGMTIIDGTIACNW